MKSACRAPLAARVHEHLLDRLARRAAVTPTQELLSRLSGWTRNDISHLRNSRFDYFGWDRVFTAALVLGVPIADAWAAHEQEIAA